MRRKWLSVGAGFAAGLVNGLFGAGGGLILVPLFCRQFPDRPKHAFANSVAVTAPLCVCSFLLFQLYRPISPASAVPYLLGGAIGGAFAGKALHKMSAVWLQRIFGLLLLYGGLRALL